MHAKRSATLDASEPRDPHSAVLSCACRPSAQRRAATLVDAPWHVDRRYALHVRLAHAPRVRSDPCKETAMSKFTATIKHEFLEMLPPTIFFFVILHIVALIRSLLTLDAGITLPTSGAVTLAALILGKSVLLANMLPFINRFPEKPLIWNVSWKSLMYTLVALGVHYLERLYDFWKETHALGEANRTLLAHMDWAHFWGVQLLLVTLIVNYCVMAELARIIGRDKLLAMFFGPVRAKPDERIDR
jgi:hypothetical protein